MPILKTSLKKGDLQERKLVKVDVSENTFVILTV
jgi:hypothetical protein